MTGEFNPWNSFNDQDIANLVSWGQNIIRLGVMWPGVMIGDGKYNETYLDVIEGIINKAGKSGIYTLVDMH